MEQPWRNWSVPFIVPRALLESRQILRDFRPDVLLGTGGYVSAPLVVVASARRIPVVLQEQNYLPGRTTRLLSRFARVVATGYEESAQYLHAKSVVTGTPVRPEFTNRRQDFPARPRRLLILGGSQGAHRINEAIGAALPDLLGRLQLEVWHQTGERDLAQMLEIKSHLASQASAYQPFAFADDLAAKIYAADIVLSRAGASALSEVSAAGIPMMLVPGPFAGGHQRLNAQPFERAGAAVLIPNEECDGPRIVKELSEIVENGARYSKMVDAMRALGRPHAADDVVGLLQAVVKH
jgi:UDP-N-acetylglucosamine--N-acetylmuramyl-(pentapeptide) pyrophosphoryl-undecaprenol N-acetylglucosamine transferase